MARKERGAVKPKKPDDGSVILPSILFEDAVAKNDVRHYLNAAFLDLTGDAPTLVGCNGHFLIAVECQISGRVSQGWLDTEAIKRARKAVGKRTLEDAVLHFKGNMHGTGRVMFERPDMAGATYPDWEKVVFEYDQQARPDICFNPDYVTLLSKALNAGQTRYKGTGFIVQREPARTKVKPINPRGAVAIRATHLTGKDINYHAILMPMAWSK